MILQLRNFGVFDSLDIDLSKDLTIFCGPNNTGKTYAAYGVHATMYHFTIGTGVTTKKYLKDAFNESFFVINDEIDQIEVEVKNSDRLAFYLKMFVSSNLINFDENKHKYYDDVFLENNLDISSEFILNEIEIKHWIEVEKTGVEIKGVSNLDRYSLVFINYIFSYLSSNRLSSFLFFPAERIATSTLGVQFIQNRVLYNERLPSNYPQPVLQYLSFYIGLNQSYKRLTEFAYLSQSLEEKLLDGRIKKKEHQFSFTPTGTKFDIDIAYTGTVVKSLSSLVAYFRHEARKGDFILIDEPEMNLHPDNQIVLARLIAEWINAGFKVLISTHSNYLIRELSNLISLGSQTESAKDLQDKYGYSDQELLKPEQVGVYLFNDGKAGPVEVTERGFYIQTIEDAVSDLNERSEDIYFNA